MFRKSSAFFLMIPLALAGVLGLNGQSSDKTYKHAAQYEVAILDQNLRVATGNDVTLGRSQTDAKMDSGGQGIHLLHTDAGDYRVKAPVNKGMSFLSAMAAAGANRPYDAQTFHNKWFLDHVPAGTKVLFAVGCSAPSRKHPNDTVRCLFWFPDPDSSTHEYETLGDFTPYIVGDGSNTQKTADVLCGKGKLSPAVEAQVCTPAVAVPIPSPVAPAAEARAVTPATVPPPASPVAPPAVVSAPSIVPASVPVPAPITPAANVASMVSPAIGSTLAGPVASFTWITAAGGTNYYVWLGTAGVGSNNLAIGGKTITNSTKVEGLPTNGETIYVRLWTELGPDVFRYTDYTYKAAAFTD